MEVTHKEPSPLLSHYGTPHHLKRLTLNATKVRLCWCTSTIYCNIYTSAKHDILELIYPFIKRIRRQLLAFFKRVFGWLESWEIASLPPRVGAAYTPDSNLPHPTVRFHRVCCCKRVTTQRKIITFLRKHVL